MNPSDIDDSATVWVAIPPEAIQLDPPLPANASDRELAIAALRQELVDRSLALPFGPQIDPADPDRLLAVNHLAVQLVCTAMGAESVAVPLGPWRAEATAPQLLLLATVEDENGWVHLAGSLTAREVLALAPRGQDDGDSLLVPVSAFPGGLARFLRLVRLMDPAALPRLAYPSPTALAGFMERSVAVWDWLGDRLDERLAALGGTLLQPAAVAVRTQADLPPGSPAGLQLDFGLREEALVFGEAALGAPERLRLVIALAGSQPGGEGLTLFLRCQQRGVPLPDGLRLSLRQGDLEHTLTSQDSLALELSVPDGEELITLSLSFQTGSTVTLPAFTLLPPNQP
jgi:hypothetical protein